MNEIDISEIAAKTTIRVTVFIQDSKMWKIRMWIAGRLMDLAVLVGNFAGVSITYKK